MAIAAELSQLLSDLANLSSLVSNIMNQGAQQNTALSTLANTQVLIVGMSVLQAKMDAALATLNAIQNNTVNLQSNLGYQISQAQQANQPVTLPANPPPAYGGASSSTIANDVWNWQDVPTSYLAYQLLRWSGQAAGLVGKFSWLPHPNGSLVWYQTDLGTTVNVNPSFAPFVTPDSILATDADPVAWVTRAYPGPSWAAFGPSNDYPAYTGINNITYIVKMSAEEFVVWKAIVGGTFPGGGKGAPVWPGLAGVTLGAPVAITPPSQTVAGPLAGVILDLTTIPQPLPYYDLNAAQGWAKLGQLTFVDDNGDAEPQQLLSFVHALFMPKGMSVATSCGLRTLSGLVGTVTPFTIP